MKVTLTHIGNEGFEIHADHTIAYIDAFYTPIKGVAEPAAVKHDEVRRAHLILVTHAHPDHFSAAKVAAVARRTGAMVIGPKAAIQSLRDALPNHSLVELDPPHAGGHRPAAHRAVAFPGVSVTAFRTFHSLHHNSYLVDLHGFRFFHDGDNEDTRRIPRDALGRIDALLIGPWQGSGWPEFLDAVAARARFLMHLTDAEMDQHAAGQFLPDLCENPPSDLIVLRRGETHAF
jgi:L-ascorbate metabolism protein UlaG (beta-lactamase superfamily)